MISFHGFVPEKADGLSMYGREMIPITKKESKDYTDEIVDWVRAATDCPPGESHALRIGDEDIPIHYDEIRKDAEVMAGVVRGMVDANGGLWHHVQEMAYTPYPFTEKDAEKAIDGLAAFVADFEEKVPENLQKYAIGLDMINIRIQDLIMEVIMILPTCGWPRRR